jgi:hypothetical protein
LRELALHLLDIAENSISARASTIKIVVIEDTIHDRLKMSIQDNGIGMDEFTVAKVVDPFITSRTTRKVGLGIPLLKAAAEACKGSLNITSALGMGTLLEVEFQHSHIDRMPLGDLAGTIFGLVVGTPQVHWVIVYQVDSNEYTFDDEPIKAALGDVPLTEPSVLTYIREMLYEGMAAMQPVN